MLFRSADGVNAPGAQRLFKLLARDNVWAKLSAPYRVSKLQPLAQDVTAIARRMVQIAPDRLVWGTDWPHPNGRWVPNVGDLADMLLEWVPDEAVRNRILAANPARLYGFA